MYRRSAFLPSLILLATLLIASGCRSERPTVEPLVIAVPTLAVSEHPVASPTSAVGPASSPSAALTSQPTSAPTSAATSQLSVAPPQPPPTATPAPLPLPTVLPTATVVTPDALTFYVASSGSDEAGDGSVANPWATISAALQRAPDGALILVQPGVYHGQVDLGRQFEQGVTVRSAEPYRARLENDQTVVICFTCAGVTLEGFEIAHDGSGAERYVIQIQDVEGDGRGGRRVTLRNNIIHDSRNNDLAKINNGAQDILIAGNIFYNMGGPHRDSHLDINSVANVTVEDNIFFNDFEASGRNNDNDSGSFIVIKDSNGEDDQFLGAHDITVRRNVFLNWQGDDGNTFIVVGEDQVNYFQAEGVLIENNLLLGNAPNEIQAAFQVRGSRDVVFRHNTIAGDLPGRTFGLRLSRADDNRRNENIVFVNNIWSDPTGTMGAGRDGDGLSFADADPDDTLSFLLLNNLYWNGGRPLPLDEQELVHVAGDATAINADPLLPAQDNISLPVWLAAEGRFQDGSPTIRAAFEKLVRDYGIPAAGSPVIDAADPAYAPADDILGRPRLRGGLPDVGATEGE
jgi:hypothetical protein